jgi:hypothetical protein
MLSCSYGAESVDSRGSDGFSFGEAGMGPGRKTETCSANVEEALYECKG